MGLDGIPPKGVRAAVGSAHRGHAAASSTATGTDATGTTTRSGVTTRDLTNEVRALCRQNPHVEVPRAFATQVEGLFGKLDAAWPDVARGVIAHELAQAAYIDTHFMECWDPNNTEVMTRRGSSPGQSLQMLVHSVNALQDLTAVQIKETLAARGMSVTDLFIAAQRLDGPRPNSAAAPSTDAVDRPRRSSGRAKTSTRPPPGSTAAGDASPSTASAPAAQRLTPLGLRVANAASASTTQVASTAAVQGAAAVSPAAIRAETQVVANGVPELAELAGLAKARGLEIYMLGGSAGNVVNFARQRLLSRAGDERLRAAVLEHLELDNIINLATTDIDLVVGRRDGSPEAPAEIDAFLDVVRERFPGMDIDVHGLRTATDQLHPTLIDNTGWLAQCHSSPDFLMVKLGADTPVDCVRDLRAWDAAVPPVLADFSDGVVRFCPAERGASSQIGSANSSELKHVIRLAIKAARYGLTPTPEDLPMLRGIVKSWDPQNNGEELENWLLKHPEKLVVDAFDIEAVWKMLDDLGLRDKLQQTNHEANQRYFRQPPLPSLGLRAPAPGERTAADILAAGALGSLQMNHHTNSLNAFHAIGGGTGDKPSFFKSHKNNLGDGEAVYGEGAYFGTGRSAGLALTCTLDPRAIENVDFEVLRVSETGGQIDPPWILVKNRDVIHNVTPPVAGTRETLEAYFTLETGINPGIQARSLQKLSRNPLTKEEVTYARQLALELVGQAWDSGSAIVLTLLEELPALSRGNAELGDAVLKATTAKSAYGLIGLFNLLGPSAHTTSLIAEARKRFGEGIDLGFAQYMFRDDADPAFAPLLRQLIKANDSGINSYLSWSISPFKFPDEVKLFLRGPADAGHKDNLRQRLNNLMWEEGVTPAQKKVINALLA